MSQFGAPVYPPFDERRWADVLNSDPPNRSFSANVTAGALDRTFRMDASAGAVTVTLPPADLLPGKIITVKKIDSSSNQVVIAGLAGQTIDGAASVSLTTRFASYTVQSNGATWDIIGKV
jgi:hypothetical protein